MNEDQIVLFAERLKTIVTQKLLRPSGSIPDCVNHVVTDLPGLVHALVKQSTCGGFENWTEVVGNYNGETVSAEYELDDDVRTVLNDRLREVSGALSPMIEKTVAKFIPDQEIEVLLTDPEFPELPPRSFEFNVLELVESHAESQLSDELLNSHVFSPAEPAMTFFRNTLEIYECGLFPCGWEGEGDDGKFIAYAHSLPGA